MNSDDQSVEILPGNPGTPLFATPEEERQFHEAFAERMAEAVRDLPKPIRLWSVGICPVP